MIQPNDEQPQESLQGLDELQSSLGFAIREAQIQAFKTFFDAFPAEKLSPAVHAILHLIRRNPGVTARVVAQSLRILEPNMTTMVRKLVASDLIVRTTVPEDKRASALHLTRQGEALMSAIDDRVADLEEIYAEALSETERATLIELLHRLGRSLSARRARRQEELADIED